MADGWIISCKSSLRNNLEKVENLQYVMRDYEIKNSTL